MSGAAREKETGSGVSFTRFHPPGGVVNPGTMSGASPTVADFRQGRRFMIAESRAYLSVGSRAHNVCYVNIALVLTRSESEPLHQHIDG